MKSGMHSTRATMVLNKVTWPHEVVYTSVGKPATYEDISIPFFVQGYIITMEREEGPIGEKMATHLKELMSDAELYGNCMARAFHGIWLNQLEQGRCTWIDNEETLRCCWALVWHPAPSPPRPPPGH